MDAICDDRNQMTDTRRAADSQLSDWLWRPWYAKAWWIAIPAWWIGMAASTRMPALESFYDTAMAGFLNILFFPMTALMVLGVGYAQHWLAHFLTPDDGEPFSDDALAGIAYLEAEDARALEDFKARTNIYDPRSGGLFIGNPLSLQNPHHRF